MGSSITVRLNDNEAALVNTLKSNLGVVTGSKVLLCILSEYPLLKEDLNATRETLREAERKLRDLKFAINEKQKADEILNILLKELNK